MDRALAVDGLAERVDHAADQRLAHRNRHDGAGAAHFLAFLDVLVFAQQHRAHLVFFQVHGDAGNAVAELNQFARHHLVESVDARDAVADRHDGADFADVDGALVVLDLVPQNACNLVCPYLSHKIPFTAIIASYASDQALAHLGELSPHRPVIYSGADFRGDAADQVRIDRESHAHRRSRKFTQLPRKFVLLRRIQVKSGFALPRARSPAARREAYRTHPAFAPARRRAGDRSARERNSAPRATRPSLCAISLMIARLRATGIAGEASTLRRSDDSWTVASKARNCAMASAGCTSEPGERTTSARAFA